MSRGRGEEGVILVNVLLFVALAAAVVMLMITAADGSIHRSQRMADAARARAAAIGGELSAITALRRDMVDGAASDDATEPWAALRQQEVAIRGGTFSLAIADAEDRPNLNLLITDNAAAFTLADRVAAQAGVPHELVVQATQFLRSAGPITSLLPLGAVGLKPADAARLAGLVTALPGNTQINLNSAREAVLALMLGDPIKARGLAELRKRKGRLEQADLAALQISVPPLGRFTSDTFWVVTRVSIGGTSQRLTSLLVRKKEGETPQVIVAERWWGEAAPPQAPAI